VRELAARVALEPKSTPPTVIINCITPGACKSDFDRESTGIGRIMNSILAALIARTTEAGSRTLVAGVAAGEESHGSYMNDCRVSEYAYNLPILYFELGKIGTDIMIRPGPLVIGSDGMALQRKVWDQLVCQLEIIQPGISQNI